jgi:threonine dehydrogenase-like Zn-dependent dehydrogenase
VRAAVFHGPGDIRLEEVNDPAPRHGEVIVEVANCGICGSDLEYYSGRSPLGTADGMGPLVLGHEMSGRIVAIGRGVSTVKEGDRVTINPVQGDPSTDAARAGTPNFDTTNVLGTSIDGGLARYVRSRAAGAHVLTDGVSDEQGAFAEMLAASVNALEAAEVRFGDLVVIYGPGPVGLAQVQLAKLRGARVLLVGTRDYRLAVGKELGADHVANVRDVASPHYIADMVDFIRGINRGRLADRAILATTELTAANEALAVTGDGSIVVYMGLAGPGDSVSLPLLSSLVQAKTIKFAWLYPHQWLKTLALLENGLIATSRIITHVMSLDSLPEAIALMESRADDVLKVMITP